MKNAEKLLQLVDGMYPPPEGCKHNLTLNDKGKLVLTIAIGNGKAFLPVRFDPDDYDKTPQELADAIEKRLRFHRYIR